MDRHGTYTNKSLDEVIEDVLKGTMTYDMPDKYKIKHLQDNLMNTFPKDLWID